MGQTKYKPDWEKRFSWVKKGADEHKATCTACGGKTLNISGGVNALVRHSETEAHKGSMLQTRNQSTFKASASGSVALCVPSKPEIVLTTEEHTLKAEIIHCLDIIQNNLPFRSSDGDNEMCKEMFPDSEIAKSYAQKSTKVKYMIQFGIAPVIQQLVLDDIKGNPFSFRFNETTSKQIKKQYDGYATYFSSIHNDVLTSYLGILFVGKCTATDLLGDMEVMLKLLGLNQGLILALVLQNGERVFCEEEQKSFDGCWNLLPPYSSQFLWAGNERAQ